MNTSSAVKRDESVDAFLKPSGDKKLANSTSSLAYGSSSIKSFPYRTDADVQSAKRAGRQSALRVTEAEVNKLLAERQALVDIELAGSMTRKEELRLIYVRWTLDRIDDAHHGATLDMLESHASKFERLLDHIEN